MPSNEGRGYVCAASSAAPCASAGSSSSCASRSCTRSCRSSSRRWAARFPELKKNPSRVDRNHPGGRSQLRSNARPRHQAVRRSRRPRRPSEASISRRRRLQALHDTYGFPIDLTHIMAAERGMTVDIAGYEKLMEERQAQSPAPAEKKATPAPSSTCRPTSLRRTAAPAASHADRRFRQIQRRADRRDGRGDLGRHRLLDQHARRRSRRASGVAVILDKTNFYAEMGGQVGDTGELRSDDGARRSIVDNHPRRRRLRPARRPHDRRRISASAITSPPPLAGVPRRAPRRTTPPPTWPTGPCAKCWATTCSRKARWSIRKSSASTSPRQSDDRRRTRQGRNAGQRVHRNEAARLCRRSPRRSRR